MRINSQNKGDSIYPLPDGSSPLDLTGNKIYYQYWWSNQILILCSIEQIVTPSWEHQVHVTYKLVAQEEVIDQIKRDRKTLNSKKKPVIMNPEQANDGVPLTLLEQLTKFLTKIHKCD